MRPSLNIVIEQHVSQSMPEVVNFWQNPKQVGTRSNASSQWLAHADYIYICYYLGTLHDVQVPSIEQFAQEIAKAPLFGSTTNGQALLPHLSAYLLGALNLLAIAGHDSRGATLQKIDIQIDRMINQRNMLPTWPKIWSHHIWRVSHWVGGIPAIMLNFAKHDPLKRISEKDVYNVLKACDDKILSEQSGLMKTYGSDIAQKLFRSAYKMRHNPQHADIGGLVHLHWINYIMGRKYVGARALVAQCERDMQSAPFMENVPYCLDFDYLFLLRTGSEQTGLTQTVQSKKVATDYIQSLHQFFQKMPKDYSIHKLAGALGALHEAAMISNTSPFQEGYIKPVDIIKNAYWL